MVEEQGADGRMLEETAPLAASLQARSAQTADPARLLGARELARHMAPRREQKGDERHCVGIGRQAVQKPFDAIGVVERGDQRIWPPLVRKCCRHERKGLLGTRARAVSDTDHSPALHRRMAHAELVGYDSRILRRRD